MFNFLYEDGKLSIGRICLFLVLGLSFATWIQNFFISETKDIPENLFNCIVVFASYVMGSKVIGGIQGVVSAINEAKQLKAQKEPNV